MGFRTLALEKRTSEVWETLAAVKTEFGKFGDALAQTRKKLEEATNNIDAPRARTRGDGAQPAQRRGGQPTSARRRCCRGGLFDEADARPMRCGRAPRSASTRPLLALIGGQVALHACMAGIRMAAPLAALREGHAAWAVGVLLGLFAAAPIVLALAAGRLADRHGYHVPIRVAVALTVSGGLCAVVATTRSAGLGSSSSASPRSWPAPARTSA